MPSDIWVAFFGIFQLKMVLVDRRRSDQENGGSLGDDRGMSKNCLDVLSVLFQWNMLAGWTIWETRVIGTKKDELEKLAGGRKSKMTPTRKSTLAQDGGGMRYSRIFKIWDVLYPENPLLTTSRRLMQSTGIRSRKLSFRWRTYVR